MANKNIPQIRFKGFDGEWGIKSLGELSIIKGRIGFRGYTRADLVSYENGAITLSPGDINDGILDFSDCTYISWDKYYESPEIMIEENDVIFCKTASIGKTAVVKNMPAKCTINPQLVVFKKIKGDHDFFGLILKTDRIQKGTIEQMGMGSIPNISQKKIESLEAKFPSSSEQTRIASLFTALDKQICCSEAKLDKLRTIKKTLLKKMFASQGEKTPQIRFKGFDGEWEEKIFEDICTFGNGYTPSKAIDAYWEKGTLPWFRLEDIRENGRILKDSIQHITPQAVKGKLFPANSIIMSTTATIGEHALLIADSLANQQFTFFIKNVNRYNYNDLFFFYKCFSIGDWCKKNSNAGGLLAVNMPELKKLIISFPNSISEQTRIGSLFTSLDKQISLQVQKIEKLKAVKKTLLKKMFV